MPKPRHIPSAAKGAFDPKTLRLMSDRDLTNIAVELAEIIKLSQGTPADTIEAHERKTKLLAEFGLSDFAKVRKQIGQEYNSRYAMLSQEMTAKDLQQMLADIEFERREWTPFGRAAVPELDMEDPKIKGDLENMVKTFDVSMEEAIRQYREIANDEIWLNSKYQVNIRRMPSEIEGIGVADVVHMSIKRIDKRPIRDWRDLQRIKDELLGRNCEAVEIFPAARRLVDTANQYHLWGIASTEFEFPFGWQQRVVLHEAVDGPENSMRQRPVEEGYHVEEPVDNGIVAEGSEAVRVGDDTHVPGEDE